MKQVELEPFFLSKFEMTQGQWQRATGSDPVFLVEAHDYAAAIEFVAAGLGASIVPALGIRHPPESVAVVPITDPSPMRHLMLRTRTALRGSEVLDRAVALLLDAVARDFDLLRSGGRAPDRLTLGRQILKLEG